ncbi:hypothetical protein I4U23_001251 [Adineta vaga]|nr:hypothetical protein I4U23_001251 [Adineta vaga]
MHCLQYIITVLFHLCIFCRSQTINFQCDFDTNLNGDCLFTKTTGGPTITADPGNFPSSTDPKQPISDVKATRSLTMPDNEPCQLPYLYTPGNWDMYFCRRFPNNTYTCPTQSGSGRCDAGKYGLIRIPTSGKVDHTYTATVLQSSSTAQCFDFYYYVTDTSENAKIEMAWETDENLDEIVVVQAVPSQNKWQHSRTTFTLPPSTSSYKISLRIMRDTGMTNFFFAFDEIKISDGACDPDTTTTTTTTTTEETTTTTTATTEKITTTLPIEPDTTATTIPVEPDTTTQETTTTQPVEPVTTSTPKQTTNSFVPETTTTAPPTTTTTTTTTTTIQPLSRLFFCDFTTTLCFQNTDIILTNGTELPLLDVSEPPRAPLSDATSVNRPTINNYKCNLPYQLSIENSTNTTDWNMWFCYNNQCPTDIDPSSDCMSGNYGLMFLDPSESNKNISTSISSSGMMRSLNGEHCVRYYYYLTVYDGMDWGQQISVWVKSDEMANDEMEIDRISVDEMTENRWYERNKTFTSPSTNYTLIYSFEVINSSSNNSESIRTKTIYFALDDIELYNRKCDDALESTTTTTTSSVTTSTTTKIITSTSSTSNTTETDPGSSSKPTNLALILSLAIGIPVLLAVIGAVAYYCIKIRPKPKVLVRSDTQPTDIPLVQTKSSTDNNTTVSALVA